VNVTVSAPGLQPPVAKSKTSAPSLSRAHVPGARAEVVDEDHDERMRRAITERALRPAQAKPAVYTGYGDLSAAARAPLPRAPVQTVRVPVAGEDEVAHTPGAIAQRAMPPGEPKAAVDFGYGDVIATARSPVPHRQDATGIPAPVRAKMEGALGADLSDVRVHPGSARAVELGALAFTQGSNIHVAPGQWAPETTKGQQLLGHELGHVLQQRTGRVKATAQHKGVGLNDEPALEAEADALGAKAARGETVGSLGSAPSSVGGAPAQRKEDPEAEEGAVETPAGALELADGAAEEEPAQATMGDAPIQRRAAGGPIQRQKKVNPTYVPYQIRVTSPMTTEAFKLAAMRQIFGKALTGVQWRDTLPSYTPDRSPYTLEVEVGLLRRFRGQASRERGITVGADGGIVGAKERAKTFQAASASDQKSAMMTEIDRRYHAAVDDASETKIKPGEKGKADLWRQIRDEVLFQHEYIVNLPPKVKELIKFSTSGKELTPADYDKIFAIAKKIDNMPVGQVNDYASKVTGTTTDLDAFQRSLDNYLAEAAARDRQGEERDRVHTKLVGLEDIYGRYRTYKTLVTTSAINSGIGMSSPYGGGAVGAGLAGAMAADKLRGELDAALKDHGFAGLDDFDAWIKRYETAFELEAANIAKDVLGKYAGKLFKEQERYKNPAEISDLHRKLGGVRTRQAEVESGQQEVQSAVRAFPPAGGGGSVFTDRLNKATAKLAASEQGLKTEVETVGKGSPVFDEEGLPDDRKISKAALAKASEAEVGGIVQAQIARRMTDIGEAKAQIDAKPELIYKMEKLFPQFYAQMGVKPGSVHDMIIQDKMKSDAILKIVKGIAIAIIAIALAVISFGTATPAIIAAGAAVAGAGISAWQAYESYQEYAQEKDLANVGLAKDPSVVWLVIAIAGAALDMGAAVNAVGKLGTAAKALAAGGDLKAFMATVAELEKKGELTAQIARAAEKAAAARKGVQEATKDVAKAMLGKAYSFPGPLIDPEVYAAVVKLAYRAVKTKAYDAEKFIAELKLARIDAKLGDLTPQELARAKAAWEEAKALEAAETAARARVSAHVTDAAKLDKLVEQVGDIAALERLLNVFSEAELDEILKSLADAKTLVNILDHTGAQTGAGMIRGWMSEGPKGVAKMNQFLERMAAGGKQLAETSAVGSKAVIIDSQVAIALQKDADPVLAAARPIQPQERLWIDYVKSLPDGTELRAANVTVGEIKGGVINIKGMPLDVVTRDAPEYQKVLKTLADNKVGTTGGFGDRGVIADALFAKREGSDIPKLLMGDENAVKRLFEISGGDLKQAQGYPGLVKKFGREGGGNGFEVTIEGRKLKIVPMEKAPKAPKGS
jgi:Domain of unknown function (DUF4157)